MGDGRTLALIGPDGSAAWWCVPDLDADPLFDSLLDDQSGGFFSLQPTDPFQAARRYRPNSNVLETVFTTADGQVRVTESMNSSLAGRLPWCEFARRVEGLGGIVPMEARVAFGTLADTVSPWLQQNPNGSVFHVGSILGALRLSPEFRTEREGDRGIVARVEVREGSRALAAIVAGRDQPLGMPALADIDQRIDLSDGAWQAWAEGLKYDGPFREEVRRSALILKLLLYSPSGAIAAAATTALPEKLGGKKNFDYRYAWVRDASYTLDAFTRLGQVPENQAALAWLLQRLGEEGVKPCYRLDGRPVPEVEALDLPGYRGSRPVVRGNLAGAQHQHGIYGDIFQAAALFVGAGNVLDQGSTETLSELADQCADRWRQKDHGIWELEEPEHFTMSKISAWQALTRAAQLAEQGHLPTTCLDRWQRERGRIAAWVEEHCWCAEKKAYTLHGGTDRLDASLVLAVRWGFDGQDRLSSTCDAVRRELGRGPWVYRYSGAEREEGAFLACTFWLVEAYAMLGRRAEAEALLNEAVRALPSEVGILSEMVDPGSGTAVGNLPQGLSHLALVHSVLSLYAEKG